MTARQLRRRVQRGDLLRPLGDVFVFAGSPQGAPQQLAIVSQAGGVISHRGAAWLHSLDGFDRPVVEATVPRGSERDLGPAIVHRSRFLDKADITTVDGVRCTSIAATLVQLGAVASPDKVEMALDSALRRNIAPRWIEETLARWRGPGPIGFAVLRDVIRDPRRGDALPESWFERLVERLLLAEELPSPVLQHEVHLDSGGRRIDIAFPDAKLGIEAHSRLYHFGRAPEDSDHLRDLQFAAAGWELIYLTWAMVHEPAEVVALITATHARRRALLAGLGG